MDVVQERPVEASDELKLSENDLDGDVFLKNLLFGENECRKSPQDVVVTDVTSGVITVTIKECSKCEGFFKKRDSVD